MSYIPFHTFFRLYITFLNVVTFCVSPEIKSHLLFMTEESLNTSSKSCSFVHVNTTSSDTLMWSAVAFIHRRDSQCRDVQLGNKCSFYCTLMTRWQIAQDAPAFCLLLGRGGGGEAAVSAVRCYCYLVVVKEAVSSVFIHWFIGFVIFRSK